jgi:hypothetical protein
MITGNQKSAVRRLAAAVAVGIACVTAVTAATVPCSGIYGGGPFYKPGAATNISEAKNSGFSEVIVWNIAITSAGDLNFNYEFLLCSGGNYVGNSTYPDFPGNMVSLKQGKVKRVTFSVGSSNVGTFQSVRDLINAQGTGPTSILYRNFQALKVAVPAVDAIDFDDENCYDQNTMVRFAVMLGNLGYKVTLCPYTNMNFWTSVASQVNSQRPGTIDAIHLQCYDGGGSNNPASWNFGGIPVYPGVWNQGDSVAATQTKMTNWKNSAGITGGFLWLFDGVIGNSAAYANAINSALQNAPSGLPYFMIVNKASGKCLDLIGGDTANGARINQWSYDYNGPNQRWFVTPTEDGNHFRIVSWVSGKVLCVQGDSLADGAQIHDWSYYAAGTGQQWDFVDAGNGWFKIRNVKSGKILDVDAANLNANDAKVQQWTDLGGNNQLWRLQPWGDYFVRADTGKYVCVQSAGSTNGSPIIQYEFQNNPWFKWRFESVGEGQLKASSLNALSRVLCVVGGSTASAANTHLWDYNPSNVGDQKLRVRPMTDGKFKFYFVHTGMSWDIPGGNTSNNTPLQQYPDNGFGWQRFLLERVP